MNTVTRLSSPSLATRRLPHAAQPWSTSKPVSSPSRRCMCSSPTSSLGFSSMRSKRPSRSKLEAVESSATTQLNRSCLRPIPVSQLAAPSRSSSITQPQSFSALLRSSPRSGRGASYNFNRSASYSTSTKGQPSGSSSSYGSPTTFLAALAALSLAYNLYLLNAPTTASSSPSYTYSSPKLPFDYGTRSDFQSAISELKQYFASTNGGKWEDHVSEDDEELTRRGFDENGHMKSADGLKPSVVVWPTSTEDVVQIVKAKKKRKNH
ncbi:hypothetical protein IE53DRAFT_3466 [Violaceomyces palustris]|uniref:Uncharacterized protein n=1 Tax=Violaceomyces palustris TaxID=1673888 RepID=A0ACD0P2M1_9BASI|nr:hypothetical protein IE53DRAFT_3466 [Violaceomyces palustris]